MKKIDVVALCVGILVAILAFTIYPKFYGMDYDLILVSVEFYVGSLMGAIISFWTAKYFGLESELGKTFLFFGLALSAFLLGTLIWDYNAYYRGFEPYPSLGELFWICFAPLMAAGVYRIIKIYNLRVNPIAWIVSVLAAVAWGYASISFAQVNLLELFADGFSLASITDAAFLLIDAFTAGFTVFLMFLLGGKLVSSFRIIALGVLFFAIANAFFFYRYNTEIYYDGDISDLMYVLAVITVSIGVIHARNRLVRTDATSGVISQV